MNELKTDNKDDTNIYQYKRTKNRTFGIII